MRRPEGCLGFFGIWRFFVLLLGLGGRQGGLQAILGSVSSSATEHAEVIVKAVLTLLQSELSIFPKFVTKGGGISRGSRLARVTVLMALVLFVVIGIARIVVRVKVTSFLIRLVFVGLVLIGFTLLGAGFLAETLIVTVK